MDIKLQSNDQEMCVLAHVGQRC